MHGDRQFLGDAIPRLLAFAVAPALDAARGESGSRTWLFVGCHAGIIASGASGNARAEWQLAASAARG